METTTKRSEIISMLSEACELEHGLACSYLYAAFSLKQSPEEGGLDWQQFQAVRKWAGQLYFIASQEMFHLSQAWNLLTAIGGTPYYFRPNFPQNHRYYPIDLPLVLEPFGKRALKRFIFYELPKQVSDTEYLEREFHIPSSRIDQAYTVGKLYTSILRMLEQLPEKELFIGDPTLQVGPETCHFSEIVKVTGLDSARRAINLITEQGEGTETDQQDCHYGLYLSIEKEFEQMTMEATEKHTVFEPARKIVTNPMPVFYGGQMPRGAQPIKDFYTEKIAVLFDNVYSLMLRMLQYVFQCGPLENKAERILAETSIQLMTRVLKPLGESLTLLPSGHEGLNCGAAFGLYRHVAFPTSYGETLQLIKEDLEQNFVTSQALSADLRAPTTLQHAAANIASISAYLAANT